MLRSLFLLCCSISLCGSAPGMLAAQQPTRVVRGSELISSDLPALRIRVDTSFRFAGIVPFQLDGVASGERFIFVDAKDQVVRRLVVAQFESIWPASPERYNYSFEGAVTIAGYPFRQNPFAFSQKAAMAENPRGEAGLTKAFLEDRGYRIDDELISIRYLTVPDTARRHELIVFYLEPLGSSPFTLADLYTEAGDDTPIWRTLAGALAARARAAFTILPANPTSPDTCSGVAEGWRPPASGPWRETIDSASTVRNPTDSSSRFIRTRFIAGLAGGTTGPEACRALEQHHARVMGYLSTDQKSGTYVIAVPDPGSWAEWEKVRSRLEVDDRFRLVSGIPYGDRALPPIETP